MVIINVSFKHLPLPLNKYPQQFGNPESKGSQRFNVDFGLWESKYDRNSSKEASWISFVALGPLCVCLCSSDNESQQHIFFQCSYALDIWYFLISSLQFPTDFLEKFKQQCAIASIWSSFIFSSSSIIS